MKHREAARLLAGSMLAIFSAQAAYAQDDGLIIEPSLPADYDRGRNVSVTEKPRPDYDPLGYRVGGFMFYPGLDLGIGYNDNIFLSESNETSDGYAIVAPSFSARSNWSRHQLTARANGTFRRYFDNSVRNEDNWNAGLLGRYDISGNTSVTAEGQLGRIFETPFSGAIDAELSTLSSYDFSLMSLRGVHQAGRNRFSVAYNRSDFEFQDVEFADGTVVDQSDRDRTIDQFVGQAERALSPSASVYAQLSYSDTGYDESLAPGIPNRDSEGYRVLAGLSMDLPAFLRGTVGVGYTWREYNSVLFDDVDGLSVEAELEYFPSTLTTVTLGAQRVIQDSSIATTSAYFDNRFSLAVDHELLNNLILSASGDFSFQNYIDSPRETTVYRVAGRARYLISRQFSLGSQATYSVREGDNAFLEGTRDEFRYELVFSYRP